ncbi:MAG: AAA family ATPase [Actinomycetota bacterium]|nr:AAA family ATPase [Actinomycetota bacterium]
MILKNRLRTWLPRIIAIAVLYTAFSWGVQLFGTCGDPFTGGRECTQIDVISRLFSGLMFFASAALFMIVQFAAIFWFLSRGRAYTIFPREYNVTFDDVRGQQPVVDSVKEVVKLFRGFREFKKIGGYPPHGLLFEGPPGTGKTLLAKAVAGTVGVPFIYTPASGFANMFFGIGNLRVMMLFRKAKKFARIYDGAVIFIDEIDAIGSRGGALPAGAGAGAGAVAPGALGRIMQMVVAGGMGGGMGIINELLVQMDGLVMPRGLRRHVRRLFRLPPKVPSYNILIIGATNRAIDLDPALLRPGRFDRKIHVGLPDKEGRKDVISYYLAKVKHEPMDLDKFAQATIHYSPARIKNIINEGLIVALQDGRDSLSWPDVWQAKMIDDIGLKQNVKYTATEKVMTAVHEAGHAVVSRELQAKDKQIQVISIVKRESTLGVVHTVDLEERFSDTKEGMLDQIKVFLAGQTAEEIWFNTSTTGPSSDLYWSTILALNYVGRYGMGKRLLSYEVLQPTWGGDRYSAMLSDKEVKEEVDELLKRCKAETRALLEKRRFAVERIRDELLEREELVGDQLEVLMQEISDAIAASRPKLPSQQ